MKRIIKYAKPYYVHIVVAALASIGCSLAGVWIIDILRAIIDATVNGVIWDILPDISFKTMGIVALGMVSNYLVVDMTGRFGAGILRDLRKDTLEHIMKVSPDFMEKNNFGDIMERLLSDIDSLAGYMKNYFKDCLYVPIIAVVFMGYLLMLNWGIALACLLPLLILVPLSTKLLKPVKLSQQEYVRLLGLTNNNIREAYDAADVIKSYNLQKRIRDRYYKELKATLDMSYTNDLNQYNVGPVTSLITELPVAVALCFGGWLVLEGNLTLGMMIAIVSAVQKVIQPLRDTYQLVVRSHMAMVSINRVFFVMDLPTEGEESSVVKCVSRHDMDFSQLTPREGADADYVFELENVTFSYGERRAIENISFKVKKGEKVALVGKSGSGKSTVLKLLCRQYETKQGNIRYCGYDYKDIKPQTVRDGLALISQDSVLFPMTVADNIRIGKREASDAQIESAAKAAMCDTFIQKMPNGYETYLEEKGTNLSGGQRQRLAIARAILKDSDILLLDEPTSALDRDTEAEISATLSEISKGKTVVTVAHRLSTITDYDTIIVMKSGKIDEIGSHDSLMQNKGTYYMMFNDYMVTGGVS